MSTTDSTTVERKAKPEFEKKTDDKVFDHFYDVLIANWKTNDKPVKHQGRLFEDGWINHLSAGNYGGASNVRDVNSNHLRGSLERLVSAGIVQVREHTHTQLQSKTYDTERQEFVSGYVGFNERATHPGRYENREVPVEKKDTQYRLAPEYWPDLRDLRAEFIEHAERNEAAALGYDNEITAAVETELPTKLASLKDSAEHVAAAEHRNRADEISDGEFEAAVSAARSEADDFGRIYGYMRNHIKGRAERVAAGKRYRRYVERIDRGDLDIARLPEVIPSTDDDEDIL